MGKLVNAAKWCIGKPLLARARSPPGSLAARRVRARRSVPIPRRRQARRDPDRRTTRMLGT
jgi:hypothetical protein